LKLINPDQHKKWTGVDNRLILKNLKILVETGAKINIRIPLIKNVNSGSAEITEMARFICRLPGEKPLVNLLPYHNIASGKYRKLEMKYNIQDMEEPSETDILKSVAIFNQFKIEVEVGG
jgi:pyruvate formate lyase activating enzyme